MSDEPLADLERSLEVWRMKDHREGGSPSHSTELLLLMLTLPIMMVIVIGPVMMMLVTLTLGVTPRIHPHLFSHVRRTSLMLKLPESKRDGGHIQGQLMPMMTMIRCLGSLHQEMSVPSV